MFLQTFIGFRDLFKTLHDDNLVRVIKFHTSFGDPDQILGFTTTLERQHTNMDLSWYYPVKFKHILLHNYIIVLIKRIYSFK